MINTKRLECISLLACGLWLLFAGVGLAQQPPVNPAPNEPDFSILLQRLWHLDMQRDLRNPMRAGETPAGLFKRADDKKPVTFKPIIALGLETTTRGGWYAAGPRANDLPDDVLKTRHCLWSYQYKPVSYTHLRAHET